MVAAMVASMRCGSGWTSRFYDLRPPRVHTRATSFRDGAESGRFGSYPPLTFHRSGRRQRQCQVLVGPLTGRGRCGPRTGCPQAPGILSVRPSWWWRPVRRPRWRQKAPSAPSSRFIPPSTTSCPLPTRAGRRPTAGADHQYGERNRRDFYALRRYEMGDDLRRDALAGHGPARRAHGAPGRDTVAGPGDQNCCSTCGRLPTQRLRSGRRGLGRRQHAILACQRRRFLSGLRPR